MSLLKAYLMNKRDPLTLAKVFMEERQTIRKNVERALQENLQDLGGSYFYNQVIWYQAEIEDINLELEDWADKKEKGKVHHNTIAAAVKKLNNRKVRYEKQLELLDGHYKEITGESYTEMSPNRHGELLQQGIELLQHDVQQLELTINHNESNIAELEDDLAEIETNNDLKTKDFMDNPEISDEAKNNMRDAMETQLVSLKERRKDSNKDIINNNKKIKGKIQALKRKIDSSRQKLEFVRTGRSSTERGYEQVMTVKKPPQKVVRFYDAAFKLVGFTYEQWINSLYVSTKPDFSWKQRDWWNILDTDWEELTGDLEFSKDVKDEEGNMVSVADASKRTTTYKNPFRNIPGHWSLKTYARDLKGKLHKYDSKTGEMNPVDEEQVKLEFKESDGKLNRRKKSKITKLKTWIWKLREERKGKGGLKGEIKGVSLKGGEMVDKKIGNPPSTNKVLVGGNLVFEKDSDIEKLINDSNIDTEAFHKNVLELNPQLKTMLFALEGDAVKQIGTSAADRTLYTEEEITNARDDTERKFMRDSNRIAGGRKKGVEKDTSLKNMKDWQDWSPAFIHVLGKEGKGIDENLKSFFSGLSPEVLSMFDEPSVPTNNSSFGLASEKKDGKFVSEKTRFKTLAQLGNLFDEAISSNELSPEELSDATTILESIQAHLPTLEDADPDPKTTDKMFEVLMEMHDEARMMQESISGDEFKQVPEEILIELIEDVKLIIQHTKKEKPSEKDYVQILILYYAIKNMIDDLGPQLPRSAITAKKQFKQYLKDLESYYKENFGKMANQQLKKLQRLARVEAQKQGKDIKRRKKTEKPKRNRKLRLGEIAENNKKEWELYIAMAKNLLEYEVTIPDTADWEGRLLDKPRTVHEEPYQQEWKKGKGFLHRDKISERQPTETKRGGYAKTKTGHKVAGDTLTVTIKNRYRKPDGSPNVNALIRILNIIYPYVKLTMDAEKQREKGYRTMLTQEQIDVARKRIVRHSAENVDLVDINRYPHLWDRRTDIVGPATWRKEGKTEMGLTAEERGIEINQGEFADAAADRVRQVIEQDTDDDFDRTDEEDAMESYERQMVESAEAAAGMENVDLSDLQGSKEERNRLLENLGQVAEGDTHMEEMLWDAQQKQRQEQYIAEQRKENPDASMRELREAFREKEPQTYAEHKQKELEAQMTGAKLEEEARRKLKEREAKYGTAATRAADTGKTPTRQSKAKPKPLDKDKTEELDWPNFQEEEE